MNLQIYMTLCIAHDCRAYSSDLLENQSILCCTSPYLRATLSKMNNFYIYIKTLIFFLPFSKCCKLYHSILLFHLPHVKMALTSYHEDIQEKN